jgi:hypothetical protein
VRESISDTTGVLPSPPAVEVGLRRHACLLRSLPPMNVSSATTTPCMAVTSPLRAMASRMRCIMNQAVRGHTSYLRSTSRALTPFLLDAISNTTRTHLRRLTLVPWKTVPVSTLNCFRQDRQRHTRRSLMAPVRVLRLTPFLGLM